MPFTLEALHAKFGDSLLLHYGTKKAPSLLLIDGGPPGVYKARLRRRLMDLRDARSPGGPLPVRLLMVSHIDGDHIAGILELTRELVTADEDQAVPPVAFAEAWHNSFDDLAGGAADAVFNRLGAQVSGVAAGDPVPPDLPISRPAALVVATVPQGRKLRKDLERLGLDGNGSFKGMVAAPGSGKRTVTMGGGLKLTILGPSQERLAALQKDWLAKSAAAAAAGASAAAMEAIAAAFLDESVYNLSSIVVLAEAKKRRMLLTGDARGDFILEGLRRAKLLDADGHIHVDLLKVPHHGSDRNVSTDFFRAVTADHYVISADGLHGNPDVATLQMISQARNGAAFTLHLTNRVPAAVKFLDADAPERGYAVKYRADDRPSITVDLADALTD
jgi:hypothetical protein